MNEKKRKKKHQQRYQEPHDSSGAAAAGGDRSRGGAASGAMQDQRYADMAPKSVSSTTLTYWSKFHIIRTTYYLFTETAS